MHCYVFFMQYSQPVNDLQHLVCMSGGFIRIFWHILHMNVSIINHCNPKASFCLLTIALSPSEYPCVEINMSMFIFLQMPSLTSPLLLLLAFSIISFITAFFSLTVFFSLNASSFTAFLSLTGYLIYNISVATTITYFFIY